MVPWLNPARMVRSGGNRFATPSSQPSEHRERLSGGEGGFGLGGAVEIGDGKPLEPGGIVGAGIGGVRGEEGGVGQMRGERIGEADQIVPVRAVAVQEDDETVGRAGGGGTFGAGK